MSWWQFFFAITAFFVSLGGLIMGLARTKPKEAISALSEWAAFFGFRRIPAWLSDKHADTVAERLARKVIATSLLMAVLGGVGWYWTRPTPRTIPKPIPFADEEVQGELKPANDPTPPNGCDALPMPPHTIKILIGDNAAAMSGLGKTTALEIGSCEAASIERTPVGVFFNANLVDSDGNQVVRILRNKVDALNGETYITRQSRDQGSLTVTNKKGDVLFYARYLNKETVRIRGFFGCGGRSPVKVVDDQPIPGVVSFGGCCFNCSAIFQMN
jgi:hypothetical protein